MSIFLGLIGLVIGLLIYVDGYERSTFISGWLKGLWISMLRLDRKQQNSVKQLSFNKKNFFKDIVDSQ